ncbi:MAG: hypothetical protein JXR68_11565 [Bacteroidales bacterium]|nr:hypothetical protein [Bacteroidales bacterium]
MKISNITTNNQLLSELKQNESNYVLIYKAGSDLSDCAFKNISEINDIEGVKIFGVNVAEIKDIHKNYNVTSAPTLLEFKFDKQIKDTKGCNTSNYFKSVFQNSLFVTNTNNNDKPQKRVTVYSTPTCSWCNRIKQYFKENNIKFKDIDVSKDQKAAQEMVKRSGQQGVPQTDINGQIVIGFDKQKINKLLDIKA